MSVSVVEKEYRCRKQTRLHKRIVEQLRSAVLPSPESAFGGPSSTSDLSELLQAFRCTAPSDHILTKGTHFTHTQKFTFTQVRSTMQKYDSAERNCPCRCIDIRVGGHQSSLH